MTNLQNALHRVMSGICQGGPSFLSFFFNNLLPFCACKCDSRMLLWQIGIDWRLG